MASRVAYAARFFDAICRGAHQAEQGAWGHPALQGTVMGIARGITDQGNRDGPELLSSVNPTFTWARLAQRIPVRIRLTQLPEGVLVSAGMTCTVIMKDGMQPRIGARMKYLIATMF
jgi:multidrug resistance efflux pump